MVVKIIQPGGQPQGAWKTMSLPLMKTVFSAGVLSLAILVGSAVDASAESVAARENLQKLINTRACPGCDLADLNLTRLDLSATNLQGADLSRSRMHLTNLAGANLQKSDLRGAQFGGADLGDADLRGADLRGANLDGAYLAGAQLDGDFVSARSYADLGVETAQEVYVEDPVKPKKIPETGEVKLAERRDLAEPPPELAEPRQSPERQVTEAKQVEKPVAVAMPSSAPPEVPEVKKVQPPAPVERAATDKPVAPATPATPATPAIPVSPAAPVAPVVSEGVAVLPPSAKESVAQQAPTQVALPQPESASGEQKPAVADDLQPATGEVPPGVALALDKGRRDALDRLLDSKVCTGCSLDGVDLGGRNLKKADLERADLRGANLAKANLEGANLKGAVLVDADLSGANLQGADFYRADLSGADLSGARLEEAMFDSAVLEGTTGFSPAP
jgi:uncharacterized protein YjbI with pentapeptide repeats